MKDHKLYELTVNVNGTIIRFRHDNPNPLTANQKFAIIMSVIGAVAFALPFWMLFQ